MKEGRKKRGCEMVVCVPIIIHHKHTPNPQNLLMNPTSQEFYHLYHKANYWYHQILFALLHDSMYNFHIGDCIQKIFHNRKTVSAAFYVIQQMSIKTHSPSMQLK